ncbi:unnamed protein product (macronuclear) [Paramecium tetraurelia]|uniref:Uncharacterized protein n=1 Tax=Paramecium tetraurelia TaxID=5888 RepID=A0DXI6_PARTE|nr:uncharacterized protein GSPATT00039827001 [Paramecium tetraurelia]CAK87753.1 unnamed protein product [Paramecium tetraurelia]
MFLSHNQFQQQIDENLVINVPFILSASSTFLELN